ncbi:hypothetical protein Dalu01_03622 [Deinococcus aluminii]|uniref:Zona occludens toxin N-terminal domain-containing protein n=2 Tax=Deinococcus aluminii TaxID=1656885 RepID=A0ABP9XJU9_9DEIO
MQEWIHLIPNSYYLWGSLLLVVFALWQFLQGDPLKWLGHITYISGALGTGKTSFVALVASILRRKKIKFYATFALEGCIPFDLSEDDWPQEAGIYIFLDELLALEEQDFIDFGQLSDGLAFARQKGQKVVLLSQAHRPGWGKITGTIGVFCVTKGINIPGLGRLNFMRWAAEPFTRMHGFRAPGAVRSFIWIPKRIFGDYNSKQIFGYTCLKDLSPIPREELEPRRIRRAARRLLRKERARQMARDEARRIQFQDLEAAGHREAQAGPLARTGGPQSLPPRVGSGNAPWHRPGGKGWKANKGRRGV